MYLIAYDIENNKRRYRVRKVAYSYAFGGQKSALEAILEKSELATLAKKLSSAMKLETDKVHIVKVKKFLYLGIAKEFKFKQGDIII